MCIIMDPDYLLNLLNVTDLGAIRATRNEEEGYSVSTPIPAISSVPHFPVFASTSSQQAQPFGIPVSTDLSKLEHSFSSVSTAQSSASREEFYQQDRFLRSVDTGSIGVPKICDPIYTGFRPPKRSKKCEPVVDYTTIYAKPQSSPIAARKDDQPVSIFPLRDIVYRAMPQEAFSVSEQLIPVEHRLPSVPLEWSSPVSIEVLKEKRKAQLREGKLKFKTHQTEQAKEVEKRLHAHKMAASRATLDAQAKVLKRKSDAERKTKFMEGLDPQQRSFYQQHHAKAQEKFEKSLPLEKKERVRQQQMDFTRAKSNCKTINAFPCLVSMKGIAPYQIALLQV